MWNLSALDVHRIIDRALEEDLGLGDPTTDALVPIDLQGTGAILAKAAGVIAGLPLALAVFQRVDSAIHTESWVEDGAHVEPDMRVARVTGSLKSILMAERTALNFLQRMSGIATEASRYTEAVRGLPVQIVDTRKTAPGLRILDKYAVAAGGGHNHRRNLGDGVLIKDNHIAAASQEGLALAETVRRARERAPHTLRIEVEVESVEQARSALDGGADILLLDNMGLEDMRQAVELARGRALTEASGGVTLERARAIAEVGVDLISVGALTHSVAALDLSLEVEA